MTAVLARLAMALAVQGMGGRRSDWAQAMAAEFEVAADHGDALGFALGCLAGAWRELPAHDEGRFALARHLLAFGVVVPMAGLLVASVAIGAPCLDAQPIGADGLLGDGRLTVPVGPANLAGLPVLAMLTLALGIGHLAMAAAVLDRDWARVAAIGRLGAAMVVTMLAFAAILFVSDPCALPQAAAVGVELLGVWTLARWQHDLAAGEAFA